MTLSLRNKFPEVRASTPAKSASGLAMIATVLAGFVVCMAANLPGHLSYDSVIQLLEGRAGAYSGWHPPMMSWLLGLADALVPGPALYMAANAAVFFFALLSLVWLRPRISWLAPLVVLFWILSPQILIYQGVVWKDVLFANAGVAGFVALAHAAVQWRKRWLRNGLIGLGLLFLTLASLARQNGPILLLAGAGALIWVARENGAAARHALMAGAIGLTLAVAVLLSANATLAIRISGESGAVRLVKLLQFYDLTGGLRAQHDLALASIQKHDKRLLSLMRTDGVRLYTPQRNDTLAKSAPLQAELAGASADLLQREWLHLVIEHPGLYLRVRADVFRWVFATPDLKACVPFYVGIDGPPGEMAKLGLTGRFDRRDRALQRYGQAFLRTPVFSHPFFFVVAIGELAFLFFRRRPADMAMAMMLVSALAFALSFFVIAIACDYRYLYFLDLSAMTVLVYMALDLRSIQRPNR